MNEENKIYEFDASVEEHLKNCPSLEEVVKASMIIKSKSVKTKKKKKKYDYGDYYYNNDYTGEKI